MTDTALAIRAATVRKRVARSSGLIQAMPTSTVDVNDRGGVKKKRVEPGRGVGARNHGLARHLCCETIIELTMNADT